MPINSIQLILQSCCALRCGVLLKIERFETHRPPIGYILKIVFRIMEIDTVVCLFVGPTARVIEINTHTMLL